MTQQCRNKGKQEETVVFIKNMSLAVSKVSSLSIKKNKQKFIHMLREELCDIG